MSSILCSLRKMSMKSMNRGDGMDAPALALAVLVFFAGTTLYYASRYSPLPTSPRRSGASLSCYSSTDSLNVAVRRFVHSV